jgi:Cys-tRNA(Pro)/Cys-tRNA(Cys) deacylase
MKPNNVTRYLDTRNIPHQAFELSPEKRSARETAHLLGISEEQVFKTIVVKREGKGKPILALTPGPYDVDLKALAKAVGEKKLVLATEKEAEQLTGLQAGGISPLALLNRGFQVVIDSSAFVFDEIHISGGQRGFSIRLAPKDLAALTKSIEADFLSDAEKP